MRRETNHSRLACTEDGTTHFDFRPNNYSIQYLARNKTIYHIIFNLTSTTYISFNERLFEVQV